jgi:hypothetical protein
MIQTYIRNGMEAEDSTSRSRRYENTTTAAVIRIERLGVQFYRQHSALLQHKLRQPSSWKGLAAYADYVKLKCAHVLLHRKSYTRPQVRDNVQKVYNSTGL